jgi:6-phosphogluconolactonase
VYVISEMGSSITAFSYDAARGALAELQSISTLPPDFKGENNDAEIVMHPSGKFLYGSNRGHDSIAVFGVDLQTGKLTAIDYVPTQGKTPRNFAIDPTGSFLIAANMDSDNLVVFRIDPQSGRLTPTGQTAEVGSPVCVTFGAPQ